MPVRICRLVSVVLISLGFVGFLVEGPFLGFADNSIHQIVMIITGAAALWAGCSTELQARSFCLGAAVGFGAMALLGFKDVARVVDLFDLRPADNWLYLAISWAFFLAAMGPKALAACAEKVHSRRGHYELRTGS